jgi:hypothetical protein
VPPRPVQSAQGLGQAVVRPESARRLLAADDVRPARRAAARSGRRRHRVREWRSAQPARHSVSERQSEPVRCAPVAYPRHRRPAVQWATELDSALRQAGSAVRKAVAWRRLAVCPVAELGSAQRQASVRLVQPSAEADPVPQVQLLPGAIVWRPRAAAVPGMACSSVAAELGVRRSAARVALAEQASALPSGERAGSDAAVAPQQAVAVRGAVEEPQQAAAVWAGAEEPRQEAAVWAGAEEPRQEAAVWAGVEEPRQEVARAGAAGRQRVAVRQREAPDVRVAEPRAARPSVAPSVFHRDQLRPALPAALPPTARLGRAMQKLRIASP